MIFQTFQPSDPLSRVVERYMILESTHGGYKQLLPSTSFVIALSLRGRLYSGSSADETTLPTSTVSGLRNTPRVVRYGESSSNLLVFLREGAAANLFTEPIHHIFGATVTLEDLLPPGQVQLLEEQVAEASTNMQKIAVVEEYILRRLHASEEDRLISAAIGRMKDLSGQVRVRELVEELPISMDGFEKRFRRTVGATPKQYLSILRLKGLIDSHVGGTKWIDEAYSAGYYDEAHFIKQFKRFTGTTPGAFAGIPTFREASG